MLYFVEKKKKWQDKKSYHQDIFYKWKCLWKNGPLRKSPETKKSKTLFCFFVLKFVH